MVVTIDEQAKEESQGLIDNSLSMRTLVTLGNIFFVASTGFLVMHKSNVQTLDSYLHSLSEYH